MGHTLTPRIPFVPTVTANRRTRCLACVRSPRRWHSRGLGPLLKCYFSPRVGFAYPGKPNFLAHKTDFSCFWRSERSYTLTAPWDASSRRLERSRARCGEEMLVALNEAPAAQLFLRGPHTLPPGVDTRPYRRAHENVLYTTSLCILRVLWWAGSALVGYRARLKTQSPWGASSHTGRVTANEVGLRQGSWHAPGDESRVTERGGSGAPTHGHTTE